MPGTTAAACASGPACSSVPNQPSPWLALTAARDNRPPSPLPLNKLARCARHQPSNRTTHPLLPLPLPLYPSTDGRGEPAPPDGPGLRVPVCGSIRGGPPTHPHVHGRLALPGSRCLGRAAGACPGCEAVLLQCNNSAATGCARPCIHCAGMFVSLQRHLMLLRLHPPFQPS